MFSRLSSALALRLVCAGFPALRVAPRGRLARARVLAFGFPVPSDIGQPPYFAPCRLVGPIAVLSVPLACWFRPVGPRLLDWAWVRA